jgi:hypothetical protein
LLPSAGKNLANFAKLANWACPIKMLNQIDGRCAQLPIRETSRGFFKNGPAAGELSGLVFFFLQAFTSFPPNVVPNCRETFDRKITSC